MKNRYLIVLTFVGLVLLGVGAFSLFDFGSKQIIADDATQEQVPLDAESQSSAVPSALFDFQEVMMNGDSLTLEAASLRSMVSDDTFEGLLLTGDDGSLLMNPAFVESILEQLDAEAVTFSLTTEGSTCAVRITSDDSTIYGSAGICIVTVPYENGPLTMAVEDSHGNLIGNSAYFVDGASLRWQLGTSETYTFSDSAKSFSDITEHWGKNSIEFLTSHGVLNGMSENTFLPNRSVTRAEFIKMLALMSGEDYSQCQTNQFHDVAINDWFYSYVAWGTERGLVNGKTENEFFPDATISREEMAALCDRFILYFQIDCKAVRSAVDFADAPIIGSWALDSVERIQAAGIINGKDDNLFDPRGYATRAEAATMLSNLSAYMMAMPH